MSSAPQHLRHDPYWVAKRFDRIAWSYPLFEKLFLVPAHSRDHAVQTLDLQPGYRVLDIGIGQGPRLSAISERVGPTGLVVGIDLSIEMLKMAHSTVHNEGLKNVELRHANIMDLDPDERYDAVFFSFSLSCFGDPAAVLKHAWRALGSGGIMVVLDGQLPPRARWLTTPLLPAIRWFLERTVLGDPDMRPLKELEALCEPVQVTWFRSKTFFVGHVVKPEGSIGTRIKKTPPMAGQ